MKSAKNRRQLTLATLVMALGVAVYLNWQYAKTDTGFDVSTDSVLANATVETQTPQESITEPLPDKNYGDAQLVSAKSDTSEEYFEQARLTRTKTRDEVLEKLQDSLKKANLTTDEKTQLTQALSAELEGITTESDIENLIKAKGFMDCVAFLNGDKADIAVQTGGDGLDEASVAQIRDIVLGKFDTQAKNITIVEVK